MADNIQLNAGSGGQLLATDDVGGAQYQRIKPAFGADGTATDVTTATPLPVVQPPLVQTITVTAGTGTRTYGPIDVNGYASWIASFTALGSAAGSMSMEFSHDNTTWFTLATVENISSSGQITTISTASLGNFATASYVGFLGPIVFRYMRLKTTGTVTGTYTLQVTALPEPVRSPVQLVAGTLATGDSITGGSTQLGAAAFAYGYIGGSLSERIRVPNKVKSVIATASGSTAAWTPTSAWKFRLMRYRIDIPNSTTAATAGDLTITFYDAASSMFVADTVTIPAYPTSGLGAWSSGWVDLGNGLLSATANNVLNINLSFALTAGGVRVIVAGTEE